MSWGTPALSAHIAATEGRNSVFFKPWLIRDITWNRWLAHDHFWLALGKVLLEDLLRGSDTRLVSPLKLIESLKLLLLDSGWFTLNVTDRRFMQSPSFFIEWASPFQTFYMSSLPDGHLKYNLASQVITFTYKHGIWVVCISDLSLQKIHENTT